MNNPTMLYRAPGTEPMHGGHFTTTIVDATEVDGMLEAGWFRTTPEAKQAMLDAQAAEAARAAEAVTAALEASKAAETAAAPVPADNAPPSREELEAKATELGIKFDGRTSDKKLRDQIAAALEA